MMVCAAGDIHGALDRLDADVLDFEAALGVRFEWVLHVGDLLRAEHGTAEVSHDRHVMGLFPRAAWLERMGAAGFEPLAVPFEHGSTSNTGHEVFLGLRPPSGEET